YYFKHKVRHLFFNFATEPFKRYAYRNNRYGFKRDFKLYECDDCSAMRALDNLFFLKKAVVRQCIEKN
ncbi:hypothetical protein AAGX82_13755, partial [Staphylococcus aureus]